MLWHIFTIEALLGENVEGLSKLIKGRLLAIWGDDIIVDQFDEIYNLRHNIVHGNINLN
jgi:hypothetical protein